MLSHNSLTHCRYPSTLTWTSHWKTVWGLGMKQVVDTVMVTLRLGSGVHSFHTLHTFLTSSAMSGISLSVLVGRSGTK